MSNSNKGGISFESGRGFRVSLTVDNLRIRSQRLKSKTAAQKILGQIRMAVKRGNLDNLINSGVISLTVLG